MLLWIKVQLQDNPFKCSKQTFSAKTVKIKRDLSAQEDDFLPFLTF